MYPNLVSTQQLVCILNLCKAFNLYVSQTCVKAATCMYRKPNHSEDFGRKSRQVADLTQIYNTWKLITWHTHRIHTGWRLEYMKVVNTSLEYIQVEDLTQVKNTYRLLSWHRLLITMFGSWLPPVVCRRAHVLYLCKDSGVQHILCCVFALFVFVLCTLCCQFLGIVHFLLPFPYSPQSESSTFVMRFIGHAL
jgi:hypothetical protein